MHFLNGATEEPSEYAGLIVLRGNWFVKTTNYNAAERQHQWTWYVAEMWQY